LENETELLNTAPTKQLDAFIFPGDIIPNISKHFFYYKKDFQAQQKYIL